jgi:NADH:ubiquinone oxidoreductase subunit 5 (subunit L)/multisubunit Na+/H+ antiporter MnhA subunit
MLVGVIFTALYSAKILFTLIDFNPDNSAIQTIDLKFILPLSILGILSLLGPITMALFNETIEIVHVPHSVLAIILLQVLTLATFYLYIKLEDKLNEKLCDFKDLSNLVFKTDSIYLEIYDKVFKSTSIFIAWFDRNILDGLVNILPFKVIQSSKKIMELQNGQAKLYAVRTIIFFIILILFIMVAGDKLILGALK